MAQLRDQLNRLEPEGQSPEALKHQLEALGAEEARLNRLREQLDAEHRPEDLDDDKRHELESLKRDIEAANEHLKTVRENIQQNIHRAILLEKLHADLARANNELVALTEVNYQKNSTQLILFSFILELIRFILNQLKFSN